MPALLAFVDDPARLPEVPEGVAVVPLEPRVEIAAVRAGLTVARLDEHLDALEVERLGALTHELALELCRALDHAIGGEASSRWRFQQLKILYDGLLWPMLAAAGSAEVCAASEAFLLLREGGAAARALVPTLAALGVRTEPRLARPAPEAPDPRPGSRLAELRIGLTRALRRRRPRVLLLDRAYSLPAIADELRARGADVQLWLPLVRAPRPADVVDLEPFARFFRVGDIDLWPAAEPLLRRFVEHDRPLDEAALASARAAVRRDRPDALLASTYAAPGAKAAAIAAREAGVPAIASRHGELAIRQLPVMVYNDLDVASHMLCWGEWEERFSQRYAPGPIETIVVGSPALEESVSRAPSRREVRESLGVGDDERLVLLVPNAINAAAWFIGRRGPVPPAYFHHQLELVQGLLEVEGVRVAVKEHLDPPGPLEVWAEGRGLPLTFVHDWPRFVDTIHLADAVVLDLPSTTLVQALHGSARIYVVRNPITIWEPGVIEHLEAYGVRFASVAEMPRVLRDDVVAGLLDGPTAYPLEAREPLIASGPGAAAERAADAIFHILSEHAATTIESP